MLATVDDRRERRWYATPLFQHQFFFFGGETLSYSHSKFITEKGSENRLASKSHFDVKVFTTIALNSFGDWSMGFGICHGVFNRYRFRSEDVMVERIDVSQIPLTLGKEKIAAS